MWRQSEHKYPDVLFNSGYVPTRYYNLLLELVNFFHNV